MLCCCSHAGPAVAVRRSLRKILTAIFLLPSSASCLLDRLPARASAQRFAPDAPRWTLGAAAVALAISNALPLHLAARGGRRNRDRGRSLLVVHRGLDPVITGLRDGVCLAAGRCGAVRWLARRRPPDDDRVGVRGLWSLKRCGNCFTPDRAAAPAGRCRPLGPGALPSASCWCSTTSLRFGGPGLRPEATSPPL